MRNRDPDANAALVRGLWSAVWSGGEGLDTVPALLKSVLKEGAWKVFRTELGDLIEHDKFEEFVVAPEPRGLGTSVELIRRMVSDDKRTLDLLDKALQRPHGGDHTSKIDIVNLAPTPDGNSAEQALRRLRKRRPDLHALVIAGKLSPHAAAVQAGFRDKTATFPLEPSKLAKAVVRRLGNEKAKDLAHEISRLVALSTNAH